MACKGCGYAVRLGNEWYCDYLHITGHRRPCPPGKGCTVRTTAGRDTKQGRESNLPIKMREWDTKKARALYDEGLLDGEIAAALGTTSGAVGFWRRSLGLPSNFARKAENKPKAQKTPATTPPPASDRPLPKTTGRVEMSVELGGCSFTLCAPDLEGAVRVYEYAGRMLGDARKAAEP